MGTLTISRRLALMSLFALLATVLVGLVGIIQMGRIKAELDQVQQRYVPAIEAAGRAALSFANVRRASVLYTNAPNPQVHDIARKQLSDGVEVQRKRFDELQTLAIGLPEEKVFLEQETKLSAQYLDTTQKLIADLEAPDADRGAILVGATKNLGGIGGELLKSLEGHSKFYDDLMTEGVVRSAQNYASALWMTVGCTLLGLFILIGWSWNVYLRVVKPLESVRSIVTKVEAEKDFSHQAPVESQDEVGQMLTAFNRLMGAMRTAIRDTGQSAHAVSDTAHALGSSSDTLSQNVSAQSEAASTIAAAMEEMTVSVSLVASQAQDARQASQRAGEMADNGAHVIATAAQEIDRIADAVNRSSALMSELEAHSQRINTVVSVIREVADQTNLLALNAAIEAARAGEQGRGFAVVADEVRKLAERTSVSTREIASTVTSIQSGTSLVRASMQEAVESVERGVVRTRDASEAIVQVNTYANQSMSQITEISSAISEQSAALTEVAKQVELIARMAEENQRSASESARDATELNVVADRLKHTASQYKV